MSRADRTRNDNGEVEIPLHSIGSDLEALFAVLKPGVDDEEISARMDTIIKRCRAPSDAVTLADLFVLTFHTRDCRGGKGQRHLFYVMFLKLFEYFPEATMHAIPFMVQYGYFKDLSNLYVRITTSPEDVKLKLKRLTDGLVQFFADALRKDTQILEQAKRDKVEPEGLSFAAKYAPRLQKPRRGKQRLNPNKEAVARRDFAKKVRDNLFPEPQGGSGSDKPRLSSMKYRKKISALNEKLRTIERLMSNERWDEIEPSAIPSLCMRRSRSALLFETKSGAVREAAPESRMQLRERVLKAQHLKGGQLFVHELVGDCMKPVSEAAANILHRQWEDIVREMKRQCAEFQRQEAASTNVESASSAASDSAIDLGNVVPMIDVSTKMFQAHPAVRVPPMKVAVALGLLASELAAPEFRNKVLTFDRTPRWFKFPKDASIVEKVRMLMSTPWGEQQANLKAAMALILEGIKTIALRDQRLPMIPELFVVSALQFGSSWQSEWDTAYDNILREFDELGRLLASKGIDIGGPTLKPPVITFWNLNSETTGLVTEMKTRGVRLLCGFSQDLLKLMLRGRLPAAATRPRDVLFRALDDARYHPVRERLSRETTGPFAPYRFKEASSSSSSSAAASFGATGSGPEPGDDDKGAARSGGKSPRTF